MKSSKILRGSFSIRFTKFLKFSKSCTVAILLFSPIFLSAQDENTKAYASLSANEVLIGDQVTLHLSVEHKDGARVLKIDPEMPLDTPRFEVISAPDWSNKTRSSMRGKSRDIVFTVWDTGIYRIPSVRFEVLHASGEGEIVTTPPLLLKVNNPEKTDDMVAPVDIKPIVATEWSFMEDFIPLFWQIFPYLLIAFGLGFLAWRYYQKRKQTQFKPLIQEIKQPPHVIAERLLQELKAKQLWQNGKIKLYYSELTHILRGYLEASFGLPALESTTDELMKKMQFFHQPPFGQSGFDADLLTKIKTVLQTADLVKFAKVEPPTDVHDGFWLDVAEVVEKTKPKVQITEGVENPV